MEPCFEVHDTLPRRFDERRMNAYIVPGVSENRRAPTELFAFTSDGLRDGKFWQGHQGTCRNGSRNKSVMVVATDFRLGIGKPASSIGFKIASRERAATARRSSEN